GTIVSRPRGCRSSAGSRQGRRLVVGHQVERGQVVGQHGGTPWGSRRQLLGHVLRLSTSYPSRGPAGSHGRRAGKLAQRQALPGALSSGTAFRKRRALGPGDG